MSTILVNININLSKRLVNTVAPSKPYRGPSSFIKIADKKLITEPVIEPSKIGNRISFISLLYLSSSSRSPSLGISVGLAFSLNTIYTDRINY